MYQTTSRFNHLKTGFESFLQFIKIMVKNKEGINAFQIPVKFNKLFQILNISVLIKQTIPDLKVPDEIISQEHDPVVEKNFVHLPYEKIRKNHRLPTVAVQCD